MIDQQVIRLLSRLFAHLGVRADRSADDRFQAAEDSLRDRGRAHGDAAHNAKILADAVAFDREGGGNRERHHLVLHIAHDVCLAHSSNRFNISPVTDIRVSASTSSIILAVISPSCPVATDCKNGIVAERSQMYLMSAPLKPSSLFASSFKSIASSTGRLLRWISSSFRRASKSGSGM